MPVIYDTAPLLESSANTSMHQDARRAELRWLLLAGFAACFTYPIGVFAPLPTVVRALLLASFGPLLGLGSFALYRILTSDQPSLRAALGVASNAIAGALFTTMMLIQLAAGQRGESLYAQASWLGLDLAWDVYIGVGTALFASAMYRHPAYGKVLGGSGLVISAVLLALNLLTFPAPPANAGFFDAGPLVGLWYLAVTIASWIGLRRSTPQAGDGLLARPTAFAP